MTELPYLELSILLPLVGAIGMARHPDSEQARKWSMVITGFTCLFAIGVWQESLAFRSSAGVVLGRWVNGIIGGEVLAVDQFSAPVLPLVSLLNFLTVGATSRTKIRRFSFAWTLLSESIALAMFSCRQPWLIIALLAAANVPIYLELKYRGRHTRVFVLHMGLCIGLLVIGQAFASLGGTGDSAWLLWGVVPLLAAVLIRSGIAPFHCWMTDLFEHATFGSALLFVTPIAGAYAAVRLVLPIAPEWVLRSLGLLSLATAVYASGMALIQSDARRFFCYLFLSHSALVLVGLESVSPLGLTGALCVWLSAALSLGGFGLSMRGIESRRGRLRISELHGLYDHMPNLAMCFMLTGLASVGFPGTLGFVGTELLVDGAVAAYPYVGVVVVIAAAINGIAVVRAYFNLFGGPSYPSTIPLQIRVRERFAVLTLALLILLGGVAPQSSIVSRQRAAEELLRQRESPHAEAESPHVGKSDQDADPGVSRSG
ncbi:MAG TPA: proton-conducting transporter membrane subunit [Planctomycetaceae bacterium]|nr:proton-conducting transporter membrane subunit [Planctomycetaceae bacterium]